LSEAITAGQTGHVAAHNDIHDVVNEAARYNVANTFAASQTISNNGGKTTLALTDTTANVGITIGGDANLYRSAANTLKTDDSIIVGVALETVGYLYAQRGSAFEVTIGEWPAGKPGIGFGTALDTNLYRSAADTLKTDDNFHMNTVASSEAAPRTFGFADIGANQMARFQFGDAWNSIQSGYDKKVQLTSYWGTEIRGSRQTGAALAYITGGATNPNLSVINEKDVIALLVKGHSTLTADLQQWQTSAGAVLTSVTSAGLLKWDLAGNQQTTVGAAGAASALPATPTKYLKVVDSAGTTLVIPAYAAA
jgi:hypothetical protein